MKATILISASVIFFARCEPTKLNSPTQDDNEVKMVWQKNRRLNWSDYQGKEQKRFAVASTVYSMYRTVYIDSNKNIMASVKAIFYPRDSWKSSYIDDVVLTLEQKHFDIVELYARKLRKQLSELKVKDETDAQNKLDSLYIILDKEMDIFQDKYDNDTDYSTAHDEQQSWIQNIDAAIDNLVDYQNTEVQLKKIF